MVEHVYISSEYNYTKSCIFLELLRKLKINSSANVVIHVAMQVNNQIEASNLNCTF